MVTDMPKASEDKKVEMSKGSIKFSKFNMTSKYYFYIPCRVKQGGVFSTVETLTITENTRLFISVSQDLTRVSANQRLRNEDKKERANQGPG